MASRTLGSHIVEGFVFAVFGLEAYLELDTSLQLLFWGGLLLISIQRLGMRNIMRSPLVFLAYVLSPFYVVFLLIPAITFIVKFIFWFMVLIAGGIGVLMFLRLFTDRPLFGDTFSASNVRWTIVILTEGLIYLIRRYLTSSECSTQQAETVSEVMLNRPQELPGLLKNRTSSVSSNEASFSEDSPCTTCVICQSEPKCVVFLPCAHLCVCKSCRNKHQKNSNKCPMCRTTIEDTLVVYS